MTGLLAAGLVAGAPALAGTVYINGVRADGLRNQKLEDVDVTIDAQGDIHIDAPQYRVEVADGGEGPSPASPVPAETWWLAIEDHGSQGQDCDVFVNGVLAARARSGGSPPVVDLAPWLRRGANTLEFQCGGGGLAGGSLDLHVGRGTNRSGTVVIDEPVISVRRAARQPPETRSFQLAVP